MFATVIVLSSLQFIFRVIYTFVCFLTDTILVQELNIVNIFLLFKKTYIMIIYFIINLSVLTLRYK